MADLKPAKPINLDVLIRVLDKTVLSPSVAGLAVIYTYMFQVRQQASCFHNRLLIDWQEAAV